MKTDEHRGRRGLLRTAVRLLALLIATGLLLELATRTLLFSGAVADWGLARRLREPGRFGRYRSDDLYFVMRYLWAQPEERDRRPPWSPFHDPRVGWTSNLFAPPDYGHVDEPALAGRRPLLLLGDSFAACSSRPELDCFQALLDRTPLGERCALLNYGVPGHGLDQTYLLLGPLLDRHASVEPVVIVGLFVDDGLDRPILGARDWPKPRLRLDGERLVLPSGGVPTISEFLTADPPLPTSFALTLLRQRMRDRTAPGTPQQEAEKQALGRALLRATVAELVAREVPFFFLLFNGVDSTADPTVLGWRQELVRAELEALAVPWVEVRDDVLRRARNERRPLSDFFWPGDYHLNPLGNETALETLLRGLAPLGLGSPPPPWALEAQADAEDGGLARYQDGPGGALGATGSGPRLLLRAAGSGPARIRFELAGRCSVWRAQAWCFDPGGKEAALQLVALVDGVERWRGALTAGEAPVPLELALTGARSLEIVAPPRAGPVGRACLVLDEPAFE